MDLRVLQTNSTNAEFYFKQNRILLGLLNYNDLNYYHNYEAFSYRGFYLNKAIHSLIANDITRSSDNIIARRDKAQS